MLKLYRSINKEINKILRIDIRFLLLVCLLFTLPSFEALKNIFALLFVVSWVYVSRKNKEWGGKWIIIDSIFLMWILAGIFVSVNAVKTHHFPGDNYTDIVRFILISWVVSRTYFSRERLIQLAFVIVFATFISLIFSYFLGHGQFKELYSVGHINHSAIYLVITYAISLALLFFNSYNINNYQKIALIVSCLAFAFTVVNSGSRAAAGILVIITLFDFVFLLLKLKKLSLIIGIVTLATFIGVFSTQYPRYTVESFEKETIAKLENFFYDDDRKKIREFSYYAFKTNPLFGVGFGNFGLLKANDIKQAIIRDKKVFEDNKYSSSSHTHNVYYNYLVSGGILIFSIFAWFWIFIFWIICKMFVLNSLRHYRLKYPENEWIIVSAIGAVLVTLGIGLVNTTLHHEHGILTMFVIGLLISQFRKIVKSEELAKE